jgi:hypothetical protein
VLETDLDLDHDHDHEQPQIIHEEHADHGNHEEHGKGHGTHGEHGQHEEHGEHGENGDHGEHGDYDDHEDNEDDDKMLEHGHDMMSITENESGEEHEMMGKHNKLHLSLFGEIISGNLVPPPISADYDADVGGRQYAEVSANR